jgi:hypothetical protein
MVTGIVTLPDGQTPVADARVSIAVDAERGEPNYQTLTDSRGEFRVDRWQLSPGTYTVRVQQSPDLATVALEQVTITANDDPTRHVHLKFAAGSVSGTVKDRQGRLGAGVPVSVFTLGWQLYYRAETDDRGGFRVDHVLPGRYTVSALEMDRDSGPTGRQAVSVVEVRSEPVTADLLLLPVEKLPIETAPVEGATGSVVGRVVDAAGEPVADAQVAIATEGFGVVRQTATDDTGAYHFEKVPPGMYGVHASAIAHSAKGGKEVLQAASTVTEVGSGPVTVDLALR